MYDKKDKRRIYWLINEYLIGRINESDFCDEFYYSYDLELNHDTLTQLENKLFFELSEISSRFSQFEEDHILDEKAFSSKDELRQKIIETKQILDMQ